MRWQSRKDSVKFLHIGPTMKKSHTVVRSSWSIIQRLSPGGRIYCRVLKRTRWWGEGVFSHGVSDIFWEDRKKRSRAADVEACPAALTSDLHSSQFRLSTNWRWLCKICSTALPLSAPLFTDLSGLPITAYSKWGMKWSPGQNRLRVRQGRNEWPQNPETGSLLWEFPVRHFLSRGRC